MENQARIKTAKETVGNATDLALGCVSAGAVGATASGSVRDALGVACLLVALAAVGRFPDFTGAPSEKDRGTCWELSLQKV